MGKLGPLVFALAVLVTAPLYAQTQVAVLQPNTMLHDDYLFNESWTYDQQDYSGLPHMFYFANSNTQPPVGTRRTRCALTHINGTPYGHADFDWFNYPDYSPADGSFPYASPGEYMASENFGPNQFGNPEGFDFEGEFGGSVTSPTSPSSGSYYLEAAYFTDRECSDAGTEYGWFRFPSNFYSGDQAIDSVTFYYSVFTNCNIDFMCWDTNGQQIGQPTATATLTGIPSRAGGYEYRFRAIRSGGYFVISLINPDDGTIPWPCSAAIFVPNLNLDGNDYSQSLSGSCQFWIPNAAWYPGESVTQNGYLVVASQSSRTYPPPVGSPRGSGGPPSSNLPALIGLNANSLQVLYP